MAATEKMPAATDTVVETVMVILLSGYLSFIDQAGGISRSRWLMVSFNLP